MVFFASEGGAAAARAVPDNTTDRKSLLRLSILFSYRILEVVKVEIQLRHVRVPDSDEHYLQIHVVSKQDPRNPGLRSSFSEESITKAFENCWDELSDDEFNSDATGLFRKDDNTLSTDAGTDYPVTISKEETYRLVRQEILEGDWYLRLASGEYSVLNDQYLGNYEE